MAVNLGEAAGKGFGSALKEGSRGRMMAEAGGSFFDMGMSLTSMMQDEAIARDQMAFQQRLAAEYQAMAASKRQSELQAQEQLMKRTGQLDYEIKKASAKLGEYNMVDEDGIKKNYDDLRTNYMSSYMDIVERVSSSETAANIERGLGSSTFNSDRQADIIEKSMDKVAELDNLAFDSAIARSKNYADALNSGRANALDETKGVYSAAINAENPMLTNFAPQMMQQAYQQQGDFTKMAMNNAADSQETFGAAVGRFGEEIAPNLGFTFGLNDKRVDVMSDKDRQLEYYRTAALGANVPEYKKKG
jgi:hypothetical protein